MKRIYVFCILSVLLVVTGVILTKSFIKNDNKNEKEHEMMYVESFDKRSKFVIGDYEYTSKSNIEHSTTAPNVIGFRYKTSYNKQIVEDLINSEYCINKENQFLLYDGYYYSFGCYDDIFSISNLVNDFETYMIPAIWGCSRTGNGSIFLFDLMYYPGKDFVETYEEVIYINGNEYIGQFVKHTWEDMNNEKTYPYVLNSKEKMIAYVETLNDKVAYYDSETSTVYMNWCACRAAFKVSDLYLIRIKLYDDGLDCGLLGANFDRVF